MPNLTHYTFKWLIKDFFDTICISIQIKVQDSLTAWLSRPRIQFTVLGYEI